MFNFGSANKTAAPAFGTAATPSSTGFGATATTPAASAAPSFGFGATSAAAATPSFGTPAASSAATPGFGATSTPSFGGVTAPSFGTPVASSAAPGGFGTTSTPSFGGPAASATTPGFGTTTTPSLGSTGSLGFSSTPAGSTAASSFGTFFAAGSVASATPALGATSTTGTGLSFGGSQTAGLGGLSSTPAGVTTTPGLSFGGGLGAQSGTMVGSTMAMKLRSLQIPPNLSYETKISELPEEFQRQICEFEELLHNQNLLVDELSENSYKGMSRVNGLREELSQQTALLAYKLDSDQSSIQKMKASVTLDLKHAEAALRTLTMLKNPNISNARTENAVFIEYISQLIASFERRMQQYRQQIAEIETHVDSLLSKTRFTPDALLNIMRSQYETFMSLASRLAIAHEEVVNEKENYLKYLRSNFDEQEDPFLQKRKNEELQAKRQKMHHMNQKLSITNNVVTGGLTSLNTTTPNNQLQSAPNFGVNTPAPSLGGTSSTNLLSATPSQPSAFQTPGLSSGLTSFGTPASSDTPSSGFNFNSRPSLSTTKKGKNRK